MDEFTGVKIALIVNDKLVVIQRGNLPGLAFAGLWDFPGGAREGEETPIECAIRETKEELGLNLNPELIKWQSKHPAMANPSLIAYFMVYEITEAEVRAIKFGNEGQGWKLTSISEFMKSNDVVDPLKARLQNYLDSKSTSGSNAESS
jgi:8-oxo-dGTP diphosphatase